MYDRSNLLIQLYFSQLRIYLRLRFNITGAHKTCDIFIRQINILKDANVYLIRSTNQNRNHSN